MNLCKCITFVQVCFSVELWVEESILQAAVTIARTDSWTPYLTVSFARPFTLQFGTCPFLR